MPAVTSPELIPTDQYSLTHVIENQGGALSAIARERSSGDTVFVKGKESDTSNYLAMTRESRLLAQLSHPQIPQLKRVSLDTERPPYIVTEAMAGNMYVPRWIREYPNPRLVARLCASALEPLDYLHKNGIVHRDVKTRNLIMQWSGEVALVDFELSLEEGEPDFQPEGKTIGTVEYMSPERIRRHPDSFQSDVYSMGVVIYELLYGTLPFNDKNKFEIAISQCVKEVDLSRTHGRPVPDRLASIVQRAIQKLPAERYESAGAMREAVLAVAD